MRASEKHKLLHINSQIRLFNRDVNDLSEYVWSLPSDVDSAIRLYELYWSEYYCKMIASHGQDGIYLTFPEWLTQKYKGE